MPTQLHGRAPELKRLTDLVALPFAKVHATGPPGIGKTSLLSIWCAAQDQPLLRLEGITHSLHAIEKIKATFEIPSQIMDAKSLSQALLKKNTPHLTLDHLEDELLGLVDEIARVGLTVVWTSSTERPTPSEHTNLTLEPLSRTEVLTIQKTQRHATKTEDLVPLFQKQPCLIGHVQHLLETHNITHVVRRLSEDKAQTALEVTHELRWESLPTQAQDLLIQATCFAGGFEGKALQEAFGAEPDVMETLCLGGWLEEDEHKRLWVPRDVQRYLNQAHPCSKEDHLNHANHHIKQNELSQNHEDFCALEPDLVKAYEFALKHKLDLAGEIALLIFGARKFKGPYTYILGFLERAALVLEDTKDKLLLATLFGRVGELKRISSKFNEALNWLERGLQITSKHNFHKLDGGLNLASAIVYRRMNQVQPAITYAERACDVFKTHGLTSGFEHALQTLASAHVYAHDFERAIELYHQCLEHTPHSPSVYGNIGGTYVIQGDAERALEALDKGLDFAIQQKSPLSLIPLLNNKAIVLLQQGDVAEAESCLVKEAEVVKDLQVTHGLEFFHFGMGLCHLVRNALSLAASSYQHALEQPNIGTTSQIKHLSAKGAANALLGKREEAMQAKSQAQALFKTIELHRLESQYLAYLDAAITLSDPDLNKASDAFRETSAWLASTKQVSLHLQILRDDLLKRFPKLRLPTITLCKEGIHVQVNQGPLHNLKRRGTTRRLLLGLVKHHLTTNGSPLSAAELFEHGWPNETFGFSNKNRLYTAIHRLREQLLGDLLHTTDEGYYLAPNCQVSWTSPE